MTDGIGDVASPQETLTNRAFDRELPVQHLDGSAAPVAVGRRIHGRHTAHAQQGIEGPLLVEGRAHPRFDARKTWREGSPIVRSGYHAWARVLLMSKGCSPHEEALRERPRLLRAKVVEAPSRSSRSSPLSFPGSPAVARTRKARSTTRERSPARSREPSPNRGEPCPRSWRAPTTRVAATTPSAWKAPASWAIDSRLRERSSEFLGMSPDGNACTTL